MSEQNLSLQSHGCESSVFEKLEKIWKEVLSIEFIEPEIGFFEAGGNSIYAMKICIAIKKVFGITVKANEFESSPSLVDLVEKLKLKLSDV
ncbi:MAG: acyl carrier protein [Psychrobium sp.]|nr:acyl carrier protein [Psychrobium sp.]